MLIDTIDYNKDKPEEDQRGGKNDTGSKFEGKDKIEVNEDNVEDLMKHLEKYNS